MPIFQIVYFAPWLRIALGAISFFQNASEKFVEIFGGETICCED
jgi:hypothetical protein